jgi:hypothetical protein
MSVVVLCGSYEQIVEFMVAIKAMKIEMEETIIQICCFA